MSINRQLSLNLILQDEFSLDNFIIGDNTLILDSLHYFESQNSGGLLYLSAEPKEGLTHLLQGITQNYLKKNYSAYYIDCNTLIKTIKSSETDLLTDLVEADIILLDKIDLLMHKPHWELALFNFYNEIMAAKKKLIVSAYCSPQELDFDLKDLNSRFNSGLFFKLAPLKDLQKIKVLQMYAQRKGLRLSEQAGNFLLNHYSRKMEQLIKILDKLDKASLQKKRKLSIPFIKENID